MLLYRYMRILTTFEDPQKKHFNHISNNLCKYIKINNLQEFYPESRLGLSFLSEDDAFAMRKCCTYNFYWDI